MIKVMAEITGDSMSDIEAGLEEIRRSVSEGNTSGRNDGEDNRHYHFDVSGHPVLFSSQFSAEVRQNIRLAFERCNLAQGRKFTVEYDADRSRWWVKIGGVRKFAVVDVMDDGGSNVYCIDFEPLEV